MFEVINDNAVVPFSVELKYCLYPRTCRLYMFSLLCVLVLRNENGWKCLASKCTTNWYRSGKA